MGEKERGTIEPLLSSPLADWQLYLGKLLVGIISPLVSSMVSIGIYLLIVSRLDIAMPSPLVFAQLIMLTVSHAVLMVSASIVISIQSTSVKAANLMASFVIIPVAILMQGETTLLFWGNNQTLWLAVVAALIVSGLIVRLGLAHFQREYLLGREIDVLNLRWMARTFWGYFKGGAQSASDWYRSLFKVSLRKLRKPILAMVLLAVAGVAVSYFWADRNLQDYVQSADAERLTAIQERILKLGNLDDVGSQFSAPALFLHNLQAMLFISLLGLTSFGVLGVILYLINIGVVGVLVGLFKVMGYNPLPLVALGILPHGVFEIPALILACAATLHIGLVLVTPQAGRTIGEILLEGL
ncbi:MAG: stage II sporulation protein M, partial [Anaerolineales bacterium]|nr:stage II sporulation protein M [Anaerolineales bacterium]